MGDTSKGRVMDLGEALRLAQYFDHELKQYYLRFEVVGSVRRHQPEVNDLDLLVLPVSGSSKILLGQLFHHLLDQVLVGDYNNPEWSKISGLIDGCQVDLNCCDDINEWGCFVGSTRIPLLNGTTPTIKDLVGIPEFWIYSSGSDGYFHPGRAHDCRLVRSNEPVCKVTIVDSYGEMHYERCTYDHQWMLRDGTYRRTIDLAVDDSLMPLYRTIDDGYERILSNVTSRWITTHWTVAHDLLWDSNEFEGINEQLVVHHVDINALNNDPGNLQVMPESSHRKLHLELCNHLTKWMDEHPELALKYRQEAARIMLEGLYRWRSDNPEEYAKMCRDHGARLAELPRTREWNNKISDAMVKYHRENPDACAFNNPSSRGKPPRDPITGRFNHRVVSVIPDGCDDVYDFEVDGWHNFALASGVFVHNSQMLHHTGSVSYNIRLRQLAIRKGMQLSQHGLYGRDGSWIAGRSEQDVCGLLGCSFRDPQDREH